MVTFSFYLFAIFLKKKWKLSKNNLREITRRYTRRFVAKKLSSLYLYAGTIFAETDRLESYLRWRIIEYPNVRLDFSVSTGEYRRTRKKTSFRWFVGFVPSFSVSLSLARVCATHRYSENKRVRESRGVVVASTGCIVEHRASSFIEPVGAWGYRPRIAQIIRSCSLVACTRVLYFSLFFFFTTNASVPWFRRRARKAGLLGKINFLARRNFREIRHVSLDSIILNNFYIYYICVSK